MKRLDECVEFGRGLIETGDLDPIYVLLDECVPLSQAKRWCISYWCFYDAGTASEYAEFTGEDFYRQMLAGLPTARRGAERRHFRGPKAEVALTVLSGYGTGERLFDWLFSDEDLGRTKRRILSLPLFGEWIAWKMMDMAERLFSIPLSFEAETLCMYRDPVQGAALVLTGDWKAKISKAGVLAVSERLEQELGDLKAPPARDRPINIQEVETVLCKYKAHVKGHYPVGKDTREVIESLERVGRNDWAEKFAARMGV